MSEIKKIESNYLHPSGEKETAHLLRKHMVEYAFLCQKPACLMCLQDEAIQRVRELHSNALGSLEWGKEDLPDCYECSVPSENYYVKYPCPTIKALDGEQ